MRRPTRIARAAVLTAVLAAVGAWTAPTENLMVILGITEGPDPLGITEGSDPIGTVDWVPVGSMGHGPVSIRSDGRPHVFRDTRTGLPTVVWARGFAGWLDVAISQFDGRAWTPIEPITTTSLAHGMYPRDPQVVVTDGGEQIVAWWIQKGATSEIQLVRREAGAPGWTTPQRRVRGGTHPGIAVLDGAMYLTHEWATFAGVRELSLQIESPDGTVEDLLLAVVDRQEPLESSIHVEDGRIWIVWQHSDTLLGYVELIDGRWATPVDFYHWTQRTWAGLEEGRLQIRDAVLGH